VKIDDAGLYLKKKAASFAQLSGDFLLAFAPRFMKVLGAAGTIAMFLVGGGIVVHVFSPLEHFRESIASLLAMPFDGAIGLAWGLILVLLLTGLLKLKKLIVKPAS
jgi:predicted DNA repair protein MutK